MNGPSPARLYAGVAGAVLVVLGILGFFYSASFGRPGEVEDALGFLAVNGWVNLFHALSGAAGLLVAGFAARRYSLYLGVLYIGIAAWGFIAGDGEAILGLIPVNSGENFLHLAIGVLGVLAAWATPEGRRRRAPGRARQKKPAKRSPPGREAAVKSS